MTPFSDIQNLTADAAGLLKEMVAIPSPSFSEDKVCSHICTWMDTHGIRYRRIGNNIIAGQKGLDESRTLMLCAHIDTVSASDDYSFDPYSPDYVLAAETIGSITGKACGPEDIVAGLGSNDDGASAVSMIATFRHFLETGCPLNLMLVLTCEEERSGSNGMTGLWPMLEAEVDHAIVGEPTGMKAATSERGLLVFDVMNNKAFVDCD